MLTLSLAKIGFILLGDPTMDRSSLPPILPLSRTLTVKYFNVSSWIFSGWLKSGGPSVWAVDTVLGGGFGAFEVQPKSEMPPIASTYARVLHMGLDIFLLVTHDLRLTR